MTERSDQPSPERVAMEFPFSKMPSPEPIGPATVVNPERRGSSSAHQSAAARPESSIVVRLFPPEYVEDEGAPPPPGPAGFELGHFRIEERIGTGGMGSVFRAEDLRLNRTVALKVLAPAHSRDPAAVERFRNEARAAAQLDHDNIARVFFIGEDKGLHFIAYEYVTGTNVRDLIHEMGRLDPAEAVNYTLQIAVALGHTSAAGVVHRDIKPSNVIIAPTGRAKLVDLGLARKQYSEISGELTLAGTTLGTFDYISPEQAKDPRKVDVRSDIYSLGCSLYHMLAGEPPYPDGTVLQKLLDHQGKEPPDPALKNRRVSPALSAVVKKMMASDPRHRYANPDELIRDLMLIAGHMGLRGVNPEGLVWASSQLGRARFWEKHLGWIATAAMLLVIVFLLDLFPGIGQSDGENRAPAKPGTAAAPLANVRGELRDAGGDDRNPVAGGTDTSPGPSPPRRIDAPSEQRQAAVDGPGGEPPFGSSDLEIGGGPPDGGGTAGGSKASANPITTPQGTGWPHDSRNVFNDRELTPLTSDRSRGEEGTDVDGDEPTGTPSKVETPATDSARTAHRPEQPAETPTKVAGTGSDAPSPPDKPRPSTTDTPASEPAPPISVLVDGVQTACLTLEAACARAQDGGVILLSFNGRRLDDEGRPVRSRPFRVTNKKITIRAAGDYRPVIEFAVDAVPAVDAETRMVTVINGRVELMNLDVVLHVSQSVPLSESNDRWALFSLQGADQGLQLHGVNVTVANPGRLPAAVVELAAGAGTDIARMKTSMGQTSLPEKFDVKLYESFVRGGGDLFVTRHTRPGRFDVQRSAVAIDGALLSSIGRPNDDRPSETASVDLDLDHVTCLIGNGLIRMDSGRDDPPRYLLPVRVSARNNIFATNTAVPLVVMEGRTEMQDFRQKLIWDGGRNFYGDFEMFWTITSSAMTAVGDALDFDDWKKKESGAHQGGVVWKRAPLERDFSRIARRDLELDATRDAAKNPAATGAANGGPAGADLSKLAEFAAGEGRSEY